MSELPVVAPINHTETARGYLARVRALRDDLRDFSFGPTGGPVMAVTVPAALPVRFLEAVAVAVEASPQLALASELDVAELRDVIRFSEAMTPVADELELIARGIRHTVALRRAKVGMRALRAYQIAKGLNRYDDRAAPHVPHLENLKRTLRRGRLRLGDPGDGAGGQGEPEQKKGGAA